MFERGLVANVRRWTQTSPLYFQAQACAQYPLAPLTVLFEYAIYSPPLSQRWNRKIHC
jgi:hypothetical protein